MSASTSASPGSADETVAPPPQLSRQRVEQYLTAHGYSYSIDGDGDITGTWDQHRFWFLLLGDDHEILQVRGRWSRTLRVDQRRAATLAANDLNRERYWPKVYVREEEARIAVYSEMSVDLEKGVADDQLGQFISCGLGTGVKAFESLERLLPGEDQSDVGPVGPDGPLEG